MGRATVLQEVLNMRFEDVYGRFTQGRLNCDEASDLLGISVSSFRRRRRRYEEEGLAGLADGRLGKASARRVPVDEVNEMLALFETRYFDFTVKHFQDKLVASHGYTRSYSWTKGALQAHGLGEELEEGVGLAGAGRADDRDRLPPLHLERDIRSTGCPSRYAKVTSSKATATSSSIFGASLSVSIERVGASGSSVSRRPKMRSVDARDCWMIVYFVDRSRIGTKNFWMY